MIGGRYCLFVIACLASLITANAYAFDGVRSEYAALNSLVNASKVTASEVITKAGSTGLMSDGAKAVSRVDFTGAGGRAASGELAVTLGRRAIIGEAATLLARGLPVVGTLLLAYDLYDHFRIKPGADGLVQDPGEAQRLTDQWCVGSPPNLRFCSGSQFGSAQLEFSSIRAAFRAGYAYELGLGYMFVQRGTLSCGGTVCGGIDLFIYYPGSTTGPGSSYYAAVSPGMVSNLTQALGCRVGGPGWDNLCPSGDGPVASPVTPAVAADYANMFNYPAPLAPDMGALLREITGFGPVAIPADAKMDMEVSTVTPAAIQGGTVTTSNPDGSTKEVSTDYAPAQGLTGNGRYGLTQPWRERITTTTKDPQGNTTSVSFSNTVPGSTAGAPIAGSASAAAPDPCVLNPSRIGCLTPGELPDEPLPGVEHPVTWAPAVGWGASDAACPAPKVVTVMGQAVTIDNSILCKYLVALRLIIIAMAGIAGAYIFIGGFKD